MPQPDDTKQQSDSRTKDTLRRNLPGMRIIKTAIAVFLCLATNYFRPSPFPVQSSVTAVICLQPDIRSSRRIALNRVVGTLIAGMYSYVFLILVVETFHVDSGSFLFSLLISLGIIPLIQLIVSLKRPGSVVIASVVFLAICLTKADSSILEYTTGRVVDTLFGIGYALLVNWLPVLNSRRLLEADEIKKI